MTFSDREIAVRGRHRAILVLQHAIDYVLRTADGVQRFTDDASVDAYYILDRAINRVRI